MKLFQWLAMLTVVWISSCGVTPTKLESVRAASFAPTPGKSLIYVYRPSRLLGAAVNARVSIDKRSKGELPNGKFMCLEVSPGPHELLAGGRLIRFNANGNSCYYFKMNISANDTGVRLANSPGQLAIFSFNFQSHQVSDPPARQEIQRCGQVAAVDAPITSALVVDE